MLALDENGGPMWTAAIPILVGFWMVKTPSSFDPFLSVLIETPVSTSQFLLFT
jgi:hypothetical protein